MMAALAAIIPGAEAWPRFTRNKSEQFEARLSLVEVLASASIFFAGMAGSRLPIAVAHGEGYRRLLAARRCRAGASRRCASSTTTAQPTEAYPVNPNGSAGGLTGGDDGGRSLHGADAAPGARLPQRADELDARATAASAARGCGCSKGRVADWLVEPTDGLKKPGGWALYESTVRIRLPCFGAASIHSPDAKESRHGQIREAAFPTATAPSPRT